MITYNQARRDHEYLWKTYGPAHDMTDRFVDQHSLNKLLKSPTKISARSIYIDMINYWFDVGIEDGSNGNFNTIAKYDNIVVEIAERYCIRHILDSWGISK